MGKAGEQLIILKNQRGGLSGHHQECLPPACLNFKLPGTHNTVI